MHQSAHKATTVTDYRVRAELDPTVTPSRLNELAGLLAGYHPRISATATGGTRVEFVVTGHDVWQAILTAMVALSNARCSPTAVHAALVGAREQSAQAEHGS